jgi:hypothetical protein
MADKNNCLVYDILTDVSILRKIYNSDTTNICKKIFSGGNVHITAQG